MKSPKARLLVVDDDPGTLFTYRKALELGGYDVRTAGTGREGLALLRSVERFDLVLSDMRMLDGSGLELLAEVRESGPDVPVVIITAFGTCAVRAAARLIGAADFLDKLPDIDGLLDIVRRNLKRDIEGQTSRPRAISKPASISHAAWRWAGIVAPLTRVADDVPTVADWGNEIATAPSTIKIWCAVVDVHAKDSLDLGRALRVVSKYGGRTFDWRRALAIVAPSTLDRFLMRAGLSKNETLPDLRTFLRTQRFVSDPDLLAALSLLLAPSNPSAS